MDEARRFLRYVVPALTFLIETSGLLLVTNAACLASVPELLQKGGMALAVLVIAGAGGLGIQPPPPQSVLGPFVLWHRLLRVSEDCSWARKTQARNLWREG
jgi:hypothetical protein